MVNAKPEMNMVKNKRDDRMTDAEWDTLRWLWSIEISRKECAEFLEISPARVSQLQKAGHLHSQPNGKLNFRDACVEYADYLEHRPGAGRPIGS
jgi:hypothetical protein